MAVPNGTPPSQLSLNGEVVIAQSQVSIGRAATGEVLLIIQPQGTALSIVVMMGNPEAGQVGRALVEQGTGLVMPP